MENPLSKPTVAELRKAAAMAADAAFKCRAAKEAGVDVSEQEARCTHLQAAVQQALNVYDDFKNWSLKALTGDESEPS